MLSLPEWPTAVVLLARLLAEVCARLLCERVFRGQRSILTFRLLRNNIGLKSDTRPDVSGHDEKGQYFFRRENILRLSFFHQRTPNHTAKVEQMHANFLSSSRLVSSRPLSMHTLSLDCESRRLTQSSARAHLICRRAPLLARTTTITSTNCATTTTTTTPTAKARTILRGGQSILGLLGRRGRLELFESCSNESSDESVRRLIRRLCGPSQLS